MIDKTTIARKLRKNLTEEEKKLWYHLRLRNLGVKFRRQVPIGKYIVDFACLNRKLIIEIDGGQHLENKKDSIRDDWLESKGFKVLRFWNNEVFENIESVLEKIKEAI
jgi:very-short-patch-repair endonuclease